MHLLYLFSVLVLVSSQDICSSSDTGFHDQQQAVVCYAGNFLTKMLGELDGGQAKSVEHVRVHLLPYLGGIPTLQALKTDQPGNASCTVCYTDLPTSTGLTGLRNSLTDAQLKAYDSLNVCYAILTERVLGKLPQTKDGIWISRSIPFPTNPFGQTVELFKSLFTETQYSLNSCRQ